MFLLGVFLFISSIVLLYRGSKVIVISGMLLRAHHQHREAQKAFKIGIGFVLIGLILFLVGLAIIF